MTITTSLGISLPPRFNFVRTVKSHGWYTLPPFQFSDDQSRLSFALGMGADDAVSVRISPSDDSLAAEIVHSRPLGVEERDWIERKIRYVLRLDDDLAGFYSMTEASVAYRWIAETGMGRLMRSASVFEDLVKLLCTTNCNWSMTLLMTGNLVRKLGTEGAGGNRSFPTPERMAAVSERFYVKEVKAGYRAAYLRTLAQRVVGGDLDPESWLSRTFTSESLRKEIGSVKGAGRYVVESALRLLGRYEGLALDSWCRKKYSQVHHRGRAVKDVTIARRYRRFGEWQGLVLWCDLTRDWFDGGDADFTLSGG